MILKDSLLLNEYVNRNNLPAITNKLMDASNIKIANNKYGNRVQTVIDKIVEKADNVTKAINQEVINTDYNFKVGTGTNVDVSSDVQDGFGEIGLKGISYQNIFNDTTCVRNGTYNPATNEFINTADEWFTIAKTELLKPNTTYTLLFLYKSTVDKIRVRFDNDTEVNNGTTIIRDYGDISATNNFQQFKQTFTTSSKVDIARLLIRECYNGTVTIKYPILLEGNYTNNSNLPSYFEGIVGVGDKSKNLFNGDIYKGIGLDSGNGNVSTNTTRDTTDYIKVKPNTSYTISGCTAMGRAMYDSDKQHTARFDSVPVINKTTTFTTTSNAEYIRFSVINTEQYQIQIEEGSVATPYEPYYEGHKIEILSNGKNLVNANNITSKCWVIDGKVQGSNDNYLTPMYNIIPNTLYQNNKNFSYNWLYDKNKNFLRLVQGDTFNSGENAYYCITGKSYALSNGELDLRDFMVSEQIFISNYEPYKENRIQIKLNDPLMRLPNGIHDEVTIDGKLIRRIGKIVFNGSENWNWGGWSDANKIELYAGDNVKLIPTPKSYLSDKHYICDKLKSLPYSGNITNAYIDCVVFSGERVSLFFDLKKVTTILESDDRITKLNKTKQWLSQNPVIVYYELAEPIVTDIISPSVRTYKDGHLTFNTLVAPESTHLVQLNKSAQINNTLEQVQSLNKKIDALDIIYNSLISSTSNTLSNLNK